MAKSSWNFPEKSEFKKKDSRVLCSQFTIYIFSIQNLKKYLDFPQILVPLYNYDFIHTKFKKRLSFSPKSCVASSQLRFYPYKIEKKDSDFFLNFFVASPQLRFYGYKILKRLRFFPEILTNIWAGGNYDEHVGCLSRGLWMVSWHCAAIILIE